MHYLLMEAIKLGSMQGFCHVISNHLVCQTIFYVNVAFGLLIGNVEVSDVQMMRVLASILASVVLKQHGTCVVLIEIFSLTGYPCDLRNNHVDIIGEMILSAATTSTSVELLVFIPCFLLREVMAPSPIEMVGPVRHLKSSCNAKAASQCHLRHPEPSALNVNLSFTVCLRNHSI